LQISLKTTFLKMAHKMYTFKKCYLSYLTDNNFVKINERGLNEMF